MSEDIRNTNGDGNKDCEINAAKRLILKIRKAHPRMPMVWLADSLYATAPFVNLLQLNSKDSFILRAKESDHKTLYSSNSGHFEKTKDAREAADIFELRDLVRSDISRLKSAIRTAAISNRFKSSIQVKTLELEPGNRQAKWHGVALDPQIITIEK